MLVQKHALAEEKDRANQEKEQAYQRKDVAYRHVKAAYEQVKMELAILRRINFIKRSEQLPNLQTKLFKKDTESDLADLETTLDNLGKQLAMLTDTKHTSRTPARMRLSSDLPLVDIHHALEAVVCSCGVEMRHMGDDVSQKLDYVPDTFTVENHIHPKYVCDCCKTLTQALVPAHIIDKGLVTTGLLASVLIMSTLFTYRFTDKRQYLSAVAYALREEILAHSVLMKN